MIGAIHILGFTLGTDAPAGFAFTFADSFSSHHENPMVRLPITGGSKTIESNAA
jgi:hypothetical protein